MIRRSAKPDTVVDTCREVVEHVVLCDVPWKGYEALLEAFGDRRLRHSYDDGMLEIMSPLKRHDRNKKLLARLLEMAAYELDIEIQGIGSTTLRKEAQRKGLEPDECYYVAHEADVRFEEDYDPNRDPPPDLALEVDVTHSEVGRMEIYASLGVPEVWRLKDDNLTYYRLSREGKYVRTPRSKAFPLLTPSIVEKFIQRRREVSENQVIREFVAWLRDISKKS
jgi:Uma2 family endonuclease